MKRMIQTLLVLTAATAVCLPAFAGGEKEVRFVLTSAAEPSHRTDNTAAVASVIVAVGFTLLAVRRLQRMDVP